MARPSNKVATLWMNGPLRRIDAICLRSMVANGLDLTLYTFGDIPNAPNGAKLADAAEILDRKLIDRLQLVKRAERNHRQPVQHFSDFFRVMLMQQEKGLWLDSDVFVFKPFSYDADEVFFAKEDRVRIGSPVYYLPPGHPVIGEYERLMAQDSLLPDWLGFRRGTLKPLWWKLRGIAYSPPDLGITLYGNDAFTRLAKRHGDYRKARPKSLFYHWSAAQSDWLFQPRDFRFFLTDPRHLGIHVHHKKWEQQPTQKGSWWEWAQEIYA